MIQPTQKYRFDLGNPLIIDRPEGKQKAGIRKYKSINWLRAIFVKTVKFENGILLNKTSAIKYLRRHKNDLAYAIPSTEHPNNLDRDLAHLTNDKIIKYLNYLKAYNPYWWSNSRAIARTQPAQPQSVAPLQPIVQPTRAPQTNQPQPAAPTQAPTYSQPRPAQQTNILAPPAAQRPTPVPLRSGGFGFSSSPDSFTTNFAQASQRHQQRVAQRQQDFVQNVQQLLKGPDLLNFFAQPQTSVQPARPVQAIPSRPPMVQASAPRSVIQTSQNPKTQATTFTTQNNLGPLTARPDQTLRSVPVPPPIISITAPEPIKSDCKEAKPDSEKNLTQPEPVPTPIPVPIEQPTENVQHPPKPSSSNEDRDSDDELASTATPVPVEQPEAMVPHSPDPASSDDINSSDDELASTAAPVPVEQPTEDVQHPPKPSSSNDSNDTDDELDPHVLNLQSQTSLKTSHIVKPAHDYSELAKSLNQIKPLLSSLGTHVTPTLKPIFTQLIHTQIPNSRNHQNIVNRCVDEHLPKFLDFIKHHEITQQSLDTFLTNLLNQISQLVQQLLQQEQIQQQIYNAQYHQPHQYHLQQQLQQQNIKSHKLEEHYYL